ncbi:unnamed protein product, partial [Choristocarpus tenellus]
MALVIRPPDIIAYMSLFAVLLAEKVADMIGVVEIKLGEGKVSMNMTDMNQVLVERLHMGKEDGVSLKDGKLRQKNRMSVSLRGQGHRFDRPISTRLLCASIWVIMLYLTFLRSVGAECKGQPDRIGTGYCTPENNNEGCDYDGGDCCECTCVSYNSPCGSNGYNCLDPEIDDCTTSPTPAPTVAIVQEPCEPAHQTWQVQSTLNATNLSQALKCSNGSFRVNWTGAIVVEETISVFDGTLLDVTGYGPLAVADGGGTTQLFSVIRASLKMSNMSITNGHAENGGGLSVTSNSAVSWRGKMAFTNNIADRDGGTLFLRNSTAFWDDQTSFINNNGGAQGRGGVIAVLDTSSVAW